MKLSRVVSSLFCLFTSLNALNVGSEEFNLKSSSYLKRQILVEEQDSNLFLCCIHRTSRPSFWIYKILCYKNQYKVIRMEKYILQSVKRRLRRDIFVESTEELLHIRHRRSENSEEEVLHMRHKRSLGSDGGNIFGMLVVLLLFLFCIALLIWFFSAIRSNNIR